jgi:hypothetical protein
MQNIRIIYSLRVGYLISTDWYPLFTPFWKLSTPFDSSFLMDIPLDSSITLCRPFSEPIVPASQRRFLFNLSLFRS